MHAVAPGAKVDYVASASCLNDDFLDALNKVIDGHLANMVTNSWGGIDEDNGSPELNTAYEQVFEQAAATGIGVYFSAGDSGDGSSDSPDGLPTLEAPADNPYVTAVGGTAIAIGADGTRRFGPVGARRDRCSRPGRGCRRLPVTMSTVAVAAPVGSSPSPRTRRG